MQLTEILIWVKVAWGDARIGLTDDTEQPLVTLLSDEQGMEMLFIRINNAFIHRLTASFRQENLPLLNYLRGNADKLQCRIRVLHIDGTAERIDDGVVLFLGVHLQPQVYETTVAFELREDYAMLFAHDALRGNIKHLAYKVSKSPRSAAKGKRVKIEF